MADEHFGPGPGNRQDPGLWPILDDDHQRRPRLFCPFEQCALASAQARQIDSRDVLRADLGEFVGEMTLGRADIVRGQPRCSHDDGRFCAERRH